MQLEFVPEGIYAHENQTQNFKLIDYVHNNLNDSMMSVIVE